MSILCKDFIHEGIIFDLLCVCIFSWIIGFKYKLYGSIFYLGQKFMNISCKLVSDSLFYVFFSILSKSSWTIKSMAWIVISFLLVVQEKIIKFLLLKKKTNRSFNSKVRNRKEYHNPDFLTHVATYQNIDEIGSCFNIDVFNPHGYEKK